MQSEQQRIVGEVVQQGSRTDKGYVFVREAGARENLFAHASAFRPEWRGEAFCGVIGRAVSFEIEECFDGRRRAVRIEVFDEGAS
jgi:hypothetical protein